MIISAKQFCIETGFPVKLIRRLCRTGILPHWQSGKVYLLDKEKTLTKMEMLKAMPVYQPAPTAPYKEKYQRIGKRQHVGSMTQELKEMIKQRKNRHRGNGSGQGRERKDTGISLNKSPIIIS